MAWVMDTYSMHVGRTENAVVTGKPVEMGGSLGRREATGRGVMLMTREAMAHLGLPMAGATVAVQGFGNVGSVTASLLAREGCKIIAIGDRAGAFHNPKGIDVEAAIAYVQKHRSLEGFTGGDEISADELLTMDVDVLVPAALENVITTKNAPKMRARVIVEGANGPTTAAADSILDEKGIFVVPDILANAGGVTVSYFEWVQDRMGYFWSEADVNGPLSGHYDALVPGSAADVEAAQSEHAHGGVHVVDQSRRNGSSLARHLRVRRSARARVVARGRPTPCLGVGRRDTRLRSAHCALLAV